MMIIKSFKKEHSTRLIQQKLSMKTILKPLLFVVTLLMALSVNANLQDDPNLFISYTPPNNMTLCSEASDYTIDIRNNSGQSITNLTIEINLPKGISYVELKLSIGAFATSAGGQNPLFTLNQEFLSDQDVQLVFSAKSSCSTFDVIDAENTVVKIKDFVKINYTIGSSPVMAFGDGPGYNITFAEPLISIDPEVNNADNRTQYFNTSYADLEQYVDVQLSGNSNNVQKFIVVVDIPAKLQATNSNFVCEVIRTVPSSLTLDASMVTQSVMGDGRMKFVIDASKFSNVTQFASLNEFRFKFCYTVNDCSTTEPLYVNYYRAIECDNIVCDRDFVQGSFIQKPESGVLTSTITSLSDPNLCGQKESFKVVLSNNSTEPVYNVKFSSYYNKDISTPSNFKVDGYISPELNSRHSSNTDRVTTLLENVTKNGGPILSDLDGDQKYGEMAPGESIEITFDLSYDYAKKDQCDANSSPQIQNTYFRYKGHECGAERKTTSHWDTFQFQDKEADVDGSPDLNQGEEKIYQFCTSATYGQSNSSNLWNDPISFITDVELPCKIGIGSSAATVDYTIIDGAGSADITQVGAGLSVSSLGGNKYRFTSSSINFHTAYNSEFQACFYIPLKLDCDQSCAQSAGSLSFTGGLKSTTCSDVLKIACASQTIHPHCPIDGGIGTCPDPYVANNSFEATRMTFGFKDENRNSKYTLQEVKDGTIPTDVKVNAAYSCDEILIEFDGKLHCQPMSTLPASFCYAVPAFGDFLTVVSYDFWINGVKVPQSSIVALPVSPPSGGLVTRNFVAYTAVSTNDEFRAEIVVTVNSNINFSSSSFPPLHNLDPFRGGFNNGAHLSGENYGAAFEIYSFDINTPNYSLYSNCGEVNWYKHQVNITGGTGGDDFPNEIRPVAVPNSFTAKIMNASLLNSVGVKLGAAGDFAKVTSPNESKYLSSNVSSNGDVVVSGLSSLVAPDKDQNSLSFDVELKFNPTCDFSTANPFIESWFDLSFGLYSDQCQEIKGTPRAKNFSFIKPSTLVYNAELQLYPAFSNPVLIGGTLSGPDQDMNFPWILVEFDKQLVNITNSTQNGFLLATGKSVIPRADGNAIFIPVAKIWRNGGRYGVLDALLSNCDEERLVDITISSGFSCRPFDGNPFENGVVKYCALDQKVVQIQKIKSNVSLDLHTSYDNNEAIEFCEPICFLTQNFNSEKADLRNPQLELGLPTGVTVHSFRYYHPILSGEVIDQNNFDYSSYDFSKFTVGSPSDIENGPWSLQDGGQVVTKLQGSSTTDIDNNSNTANQYYLAEVCLLTSCDYDLGSEITFNSIGENPCGDQLKATLPAKPRFIGTEALEAYEPIIETEVELIGCNTHRITVKWTSNINIEQWSSAGDKIQVIVNGSTQTLLEFDLPRLAGGYIESTFEVSNSYCQDIEVAVRAKLQVDMNCGTSTTCKTNYSFGPTIDLPFEKGSLDIDLVLDDDFCISTAQKNATVTLTNNGNVPLKALDILFYCSNGDAVWNLYDYPAIDTELGLNNNGFDLLPGAVLVIPTFIDGAGTCASRSIIAVVDQRQNCTCDEPSIDIEEYTCCDDYDFTLDGDINCKGELPLTITGNYPAGTVVNIKWDADNPNGGVSFGVTDFTNLNYTSYNTKQAGDRRIEVTMIIPNCDVIVKDITRFYEPKSLSMQIMPYYCDVTTLDVVSILEGHGPTVGWNHIWTVDGVTLNNNTHKITHDFINYTDKAVTLCATNPNDAEGCIFYGKRNLAPTIDPPTIIFTVTEIGCGIYEFFALNSPDAPRHVSWDFGDNTGSHFGNPFTHTFANTDNATYNVTVYAATRGANECTVTDNRDITMNCCPCDPLLEAVGSIVSYNAQSEKYTIDLESNSKGVIQNYYYTTKKDVNGLPTEWKLTTSPKSIEVTCATEVCLKVGNSCGIGKPHHDDCEDWYCLDLVNSCPVIDVNINALDFCPGETVEATLLVKGNQNIDFSAWSLNGGVATVLNSAPHKVNYLMSDVHQGDNSICVSYQSDEPTCMDFYGMQTIDFVVNDCGTTGGCSEPTYAEGTSYGAGEQIQNDGKLYTCAVAGWCSGAGWAYAPGTGTYWNHAWNYVSECADGSGNTGGGGGGGCAEPNYSEGNPYGAGDLIQNDGKLYTCEIAGWCSGAAWAYEPGNGTYWDMAWNYVSDCSAASRIKALNKVLGSEEIGSGAIRLLLYPNPANNQVIVELHGGGEFQGAKLKDGLGKTVLDDISSVGGIAAVDVSALSPGVYFVEVIVGEDIYLQKVVVYH
jgi:hypothetical protein